jgi:hypothetical protein
MDGVLRRFRIVDVRRAGRVAAARGGGVVEPCLLGGSMESSWMAG